jgi:hypothetical protein
MCDVLGKTTKGLANMVALRAEKDWLITHDRDIWWELSDGWLSNAFLTLESTNYPFVISYVNM